ncbi:MAG: hypothetical protein LQ349_001690 [Xanthoria aureola]|nr:MAG: hypothetical protein LQ349_001690 [Xanthoria aureola]
MEGLNKEYPLYSVATVFIQRRDTANILAVPFDARKKDVAEDSGGWKDLSFDHTPYGIFRAGSYAAQDDDERGMVVSVFLDPDNKEGSTQDLLDSLQRGRFGPFYGDGWKF